MYLGQVREEIKSRKAFDHLPLAGAGELGQGATTPRQEPDKSKQAPSLPPQGAPASPPQELLIPTEIFGIPTRTAVKIALGLSLAGGLIGLIVKLRNLFQRREK